MKWADDPLLCCVLIIALVMGIASLIKPYPDQKLPPIVDHSEQYICVRDCK